MLRRSCETARAKAIFLCGLLILAAAATSGRAQVINQAVGGVRIDADGLLENLDAQTNREVAAARRRAQDPIPEFLADGAELRKVSLRGVIARLGEMRPESANDVPDELRYLGGLTRIQYVFVYPESNDIVLAGPAEPWTINAQGEVVGALTGQAIVLLEDLVAALEASTTTATTGVTCSIEPTAEGRQRLQSLFDQLSASGAVGREIVQAKSTLEETAGPQQVLIGGAPRESRLASVLVAADYRMKRIAMGFDRSPVRGLPSFMQLIANKTMDQFSPRWWMTAQYDALLRDEEGLAWELRGQGVKTLSEEDLFVGGERVSSQEAHPLVVRWAEMMTEKFDELAAEDVVFGQLRNCMDLSVVAALMRREQLGERAGLSLEQLVAAAAPCRGVYNAPRQTPSLASFHRSGRAWAVSVSGGVELDPWAIAAKQETNPEVAAVRPSQPAEAWCWN